MGTIIFYFISMIFMMISTTIPSTTPGWFITAFIVISLDGIFCLSTTYVEEGTGSRISCKHKVPDDEFYRVRWFKSRRDDVFENGAPAVVSWDGSSPPYTTGNYGIDEDFSLVIHNSSIFDEGIYRCYVTRNIPGDFVYYEVKIIVHGRVKPAHSSPVQHGTHLKIPCSYHSARASGLVSVLWYKKESRDYFKSEDQPIASWIDNGWHVLADYTLTDDFSLEIQNVSLEDEAVYRCIAVSTTESRPSASDTNVTVYALPRKVPFISHSFQGNTSFINCSVDHVYPLLFPELNFEGNPQTYELWNRDGTYNTSVSGKEIHRGQNIIVECTFPHFGYTGKSSKHIHVDLSVTDEVPHPPGCSASTCSFSHDSSTTALTVFGIPSGFAIMVTLVVLAWKMLTKKHQQNDVDKSPSEKEPTKV